VKQFYVKTSGPRVNKIVVQDELSKIANFEMLSPRKVMARLELMQSPAYVFPKPRNRPSSFRQ
jgi:hypothetical protein